MRQRGSSDCCTMGDDADISKALSHALRHEPWLYELELDDEGWAPLDAVVAALRDEREEWRGLLRADVERVIETSSKRRHEISGERIRAMYGHGVPGRLRRDPASPPAILFHATSPDAARIIVNDGLKPMSRQYVHLSVDPATAREVGGRKSRTPDEARGQLVMPPDEGVLFLTQEGDALSPERLTQLVRKYVLAAETGKSGSCHLFRHTCATLMLEGGADIRYIQEMLGHVELSTTRSTRR